MSVAPELNGHAGEAAITAKPPFLRRVRIRGYKSIAFCDVSLEPLTILVGRNAAGKSNFLDALVFLKDLVVRGAIEAVKLHGGREAVLCQYLDSSFVSVEIEANHRPLFGDEPTTAIFAIELAIPSGGQPRVVRESVRIAADSGIRDTRYQVSDGRVNWMGDYYQPPVREWLNQDRVLLGMYRMEPFQELLEHLESIETYNFNPDLMRRPQIATVGSFLDRDGGNLASVVKSTREQDAGAAGRVERYLTAVTNTTEFVGVEPVGGYETLRFRVPVTVPVHGGPRIPSFLNLPAAAMSDGTLRVFAALVAGFQTVPSRGSPSVIGIEEPETALHPAAMRALVAALDEATLRTQILLTTHSPDLLDAREVKPANVRVVKMVEGRTVIGPVDEASVSIVRDHLSTLGTLERERQLEPDLDDLDRQAELARREPTPP